MLLDHGSHGAIEDENALPEELLQCLKPQASLHGHPTLL
jgi:hypothetical protein